VGAFNLGPEFKTRSQLSFSRRNPRPALRIREAQERRRPCNVTLLNPVCNASHVVPLFISLPQPHPHSRSISSLYYVYALPDARPTAAGSMRYISRFHICTPSSFATIIADITIVISVILVEYVY